MGSLTASDLKMVHFPLDLPGWTWILKELEVTGEKKNRECVLLSIVVLYFSYLTVYLNK